jgi:hypothetical protein
MQMTHRQLPQRQLARRLNVMFALASFGFIAAIVFGMV